MKELIRHIMEDGFNRADMDVVYDSFVEDYVRHGFGVPSMGSLAEHVEDLKSRHEAFDGARFEIHQMVAEGDTVAVHYTFHGVHTGEFAGIAPTGRTVSRPSSAFFTIADGKVREGTIVSDGGGLLAQLTDPA
ncbi:MAG: ester cyclase [Actinomycetia bacterium]|nr:ester cyclase [Actinomycetes bacterium]